MEAFSNLQKENENLRLSVLDNRMTSIEEKFDLKLTAFDYKLDKILEQTTKTNGSVINLQQRVIELERHIEMLEHEKKELLDKVDDLEDETGFFRMFGRFPKFAIITIISILYLFTIKEVRDALISLF